MKNFVFLVVVLFVLSLSPTCFGKYQVIPLKYNEQQEECFFQGYKNIVSKKKNAVAMTCRKNVLRKGKGYFCLSVLNKGLKPINLYFSDLRVLDQDGRPINIVPISKQFQTASRDYKWNMFFTGLGIFFKMFEAEEAGKSYEKGVVYGSSGMAVFEGEVNNKYLKRKAYREVSDEAVSTTNLIKYHRNAVIDGLKKHYFDSTTIFPGQVYAANLEVEVSKKQLRKLKYIVFEYNLAGEQHSFCFYVS